MSMADDASPTTLKCDFTYHPSCQTFAQPLADHLASDSSITYRHILVGALVFDTSPPSKSLSPSTTISSPSTSTSTPSSSSLPSAIVPRILLLRRSPTDSMPLLWETPGGAVDPSDASILHALVRELREESGLIATHIGPVVETERPHMFWLARGGRAVRKFSFLVSVQRQAGGEGNVGLEVRLSPEEHVEYVWATEKEVRMGVVGERTVQFTNSTQRECVLAGFAAVGKEEMG